MPISFNSGVPHTAGTPDHDPGAVGGRVAFDYVGKVWYKHQSGSVWAIDSGSGSGNIGTYTAGEAIGTGKLVVIVSGQAFLFQPSTSSHAGRTLGIAKSSASLGGSVTVAFSGEVSDAAFSSFADTVLWAGPNGTVQASQPATGTLQKVGHGLGSNTILIDFSIQITRP